MWLRSSAGHVDLDRSLAWWISICLELVNFGSEACVDGPNVCVGLCLGLVSWASWVVVNGTKDERTGSWNAYFVQPS